eukprot:TRINITY_DN102033_c0_g1_i1.p1 TRINITY_DN102033_c0_g1~~TRINITY_DN102033_c0_g1_i1.p1  ORF type:complete len:654 (-),score=91.61 TRINITY_DN102033_c0_g1_i1:269-2230(-)
MAVSSTNVLEISVPFLPGKKQCLLSHMNSKAAGFRAVPLVACKSRMSVGALSGSVALAVFLARRHRKRLGSRKFARLAASRSSLNDRLSADDQDHDLLYVPVRDGDHTVTMKRFLDRDGLVRSVMQGRRAPPPVLLIHDGPGLPSRYLEPLSSRLRRPAGRACYMYDQLGCGLSKVALEPSGGFNLAESTRELRAVLLYLRNALGENEVHLLAHGFGGVIVMEALLKGLLTQPEGEWKLPKLSSVVLMGVPGSSEVADGEAKRLMSEATDVVGLDDAAQSFWFRHVCALRPQPACLADAYSQAGDGPAVNWRGFGALRGWDLKTNSGEADNAFTWQLRGPCVLKGWEIQRSEVAEFYRKTLSLFTASSSEGEPPPVLCIRGEHDFVTDACFDAWRGIADAAAELGDTLQRPYYQEQSIGGCGHNAHLELPEAAAAQIRLWLLDAEEPQTKHEDEAEEPPRNREEAASEDESSALEWVSGDNFRYQLLAREEARHQLRSWASQLSWNLQKNPAQKPGAWRSVGQGLPHNTAFAPSRKVRKLAEWARQLPATLPRAPVACGLNSTEAIAAIQKTLGRPACEGMPKVEEQCPRLALALMEGENAMQAIICVEADVQNPMLPLRIVGAAAAPDSPSQLCDDVIRQVEAMFAGAGHGC